jgi:hypothetical protein
MIRGIKGKAQYGGGGRRERKGGAMTRKNEWQIGSGASYDNTDETTMRQ